MIRATAYDHAGRYLFRAASPCDDIDGEIQRWGTIVGEPVIAVRRTPRGAVCRFRRAKIYIASARK